MTPKVGDTVVLLKTKMAGAGSTFVGTPSKVMELYGDGDFMISPIRDGQTSELEHGIVWVTRGDKWEYVKDNKTTEKVELKEGGVWF